MYCKNCGKEIDDKAVICVHCGVATNGSNSISNDNDKSFVAALLLCLFFGGLGAHRFYTGHTGTAIVQLVLSLSFLGLVVSGPWALIDFIMILTGSFKTAKGEALSK